MLPSSEKLVFLFLCSIFLLPGLGTFLTNYLITFVSLCLGLNSICFALPVHQALLLTQMTTWAIMDSSGKYFTRNPCIAHGTSFGEYSPVTAESTEVLLQVNKHKLTLNEVSQGSFICR